MLIKKQPFEPCPTGTYAELKGWIRAQGLLEKQPGFLNRRILVTLGLLAASLTLLFLSDSLWFQLPNAALMAFTFGQIGFIVHDTGHRQAYRSQARNNLIGVLHANLLLGMSFGWWVGKHNRHHANPNQHDLDPDIGMPIFAFTEEDALAKRGFYRFMVRYQALFLFPLLFLEAWSLRIGSIHFLLRYKSRYRALEIGLMALNFVWVAGVAVMTLGVVKGLIFLAVQQALFGFYMASVFAPNHKGMPVLDKGVEIDFLRQQVLTARNVHPHPLTDYWYGGLNYQIEHHLFPTLSRNRLRAAHEIVKPFCHKHGIPYQESSMLGSYAEIFGHFHRVSAPLRRGLRRADR